MAIKRRQSLMFTIQMFKLTCRATMGLKIVQPQLKPVLDLNWRNKDYSKCNKHAFSNLDLKGQEHFFMWLPLK
jgi:hypothetical protein